MSFIHLHTHSHYSLLDGLAKIDQLVNKAKECGMPALALTDHGTMYGTVEFYQKATKAGIKPLVGVEAYIARNGRRQKRPRLDEKPFHVVLLAKNEAGYRNLARLTTLAHLEGFYYKPRVDWELLEKYREGLVVLTACLQGELPQAILKQPAEAENVLKHYLEIFGPENLFLEVQHHPNLPEQGEVNEKIYSLAKKYGLATVATNDVHYLDAEDAEAQDILLCLQTKKKLEDKDRMTMMGGNYSFRTPEEMKEAFKDHPEAVENTLKVAELCDFQMSLGKTLLPQYELPENETPESYLEKLSRAGMEKRYAKQMEDAKKRLELDERLKYELSVIQKTGYASYFLIVQDFINWAKGNGIIVGPGRGSAAGSIVSYALNITDIDPIRYNLLFERFLNPERISMPDIDTDFADTGRDEVIRYVEEKYGKDRVCQIITFGTMAARAAIRDVGRVLNLPYTYCDKVAKLVPPMADLDEALKGNELKEIYEKDADGKKLLDMAKKLEGVARHASTHACGVIISKDPLLDVLPTQYASSSDQTIVSQYEMKSIESVGLLKMDFLGLKNLTLIENALRIIEKVRGVKIDLVNIPMDDKKSFKLLQEGKTTGVFQLESSGMKRYLKELKPTNFEDIISMVSLYRPGPIDSIPDFIASKHGRKRITYLHPSLEPILKDTYGVIVTQDQVLQIARYFAGFTYAEADILRKAVGKKIPQLLNEQKEKFIQGAIKQKVDHGTALAVWDFIEPFARYGFNRAHASCYAMIAYQTAHLKANYPVEFMTALLTADQTDLDRVAIEVEECREMGIEVLPPNINESLESFTVVKRQSTINNQQLISNDQDGARKNRTDSSKETGDRIRFGLLTIKNVGENIVEAIIKERKESGAYQNLEDLLRRVKNKDLNKKSLESLIKSGALDEFGERGQMLFNLEKLLNFVKSVQKESQNGQTSLFGSLSKNQNSVFSLKMEPGQPAAQSQKLSWEKEFLGLYVSDHPFREYQPFLAGRVVPSREVAGHLNNESVKMAGVVTFIQKIITRSNESMLFVKIEDLGGNIEILVFPKILKDTSLIWEEGKTVMVSGRLSDKDGVIKLLVSEAKEVNLEKLKKAARLRETEARYGVAEASFQVSDAGAKAYSASGFANGVSATPHSPLPTNHSSTRQGVYISIQQSLLYETVEKLKSFLARYSGANRVYLTVSGVGAPKTVATNFYIDYNENIKSEIEKMVGEGKVVKL